MIVFLLVIIILLLCFMSGILGPVLALSAVLGLIGIIAYRIMIAHEAKEWVTSKRNRKPRQ